MSASQRGVLDGPVATRSRSVRGDAPATPAVAAERQIDRDRIDLEILKQSLLHRSDGVKIAALGMLVSIVPFFLVLRERVPLANLAIWIVPILLALSWRAWIAARTRRALGSDDVEELRRLDRRFRISSVAMQFWVGTGVWSVAGRGTEVDLYVTLAVCIFGTGAAISLAHDARSVAVSMPLLFGQAFVFWLLKGAEGYHISVPLIPVMILIIVSARRSQRNLDETIAIRFENDALLRALEAEKETAVAAARTAEEANRSKSLFMAAASHDLRQPLYAISLLAETLALHDLPAPAKAIVEQQEQSLGVLRRMFDDLLDLSRFDSGDVKPRIGTVFLGDVLAGLFREYQPFCESKGLRFETEETEVFVSTDFDLLGRLLRNLIGNAVRYTDEGVVRVSSRIVGDSVFVEVADTGCGIQLADQKRIFQEFVQLDNPERNREKGVGLGLSIVQRIADLLGHEVRLVSQPKHGTLVTVQLPRVDGRDARREGGPSLAAETAAPVQLGAYVWIVEDDALVRSALATHLGTLSIRHDFAIDRADLEALAAASGWPDYALLDDMLGHAETGLDLANWLADRMPPERILLVTGNTEPERLRALQGSRFRVLRKPVSSDDLIHWMRGDAN